MLSRPHPLFGWLSIQPEDTRRVMNKLIEHRDAELKTDPTFSGMPEPFKVWSWTVWLPAALARRPGYRQQLEEHIERLSHQITALNRQIETEAAGLLDQRDEAADLREKLMRELTGVNA